MSLRYGFQRLALLGSAGYQRAELPLDDSVSLIAPNNTGKTALINALQYLLIIDKRRMDFGAHGPDKSRRFYFPNNSAYILLEVMLPETGSLVLGCVGKGVSHDYEYFSYRGSLDIDDFRRADGALVTQPQLGAHLAESGKSVFSYSSTEFVDLLYGGKRRRTSLEPDLTIFRLEHASDAPAFQRVLTRTLKLDKLRSSDVKDYLLQIFRRDLPDASIDFKQEWDKAFAEVNADREQYQAALAQRDRIDELEKLRDERLALRGKLIAFRPLIEQRLSEWNAYFEDTLAEYERERTELQAHSEQLLQRYSDLTQEQRDSQAEIQQFKDQTREQGELDQRFTLVTGRVELEARQRECRGELKRQMVLVSRASSREPRAISHEIERNRQELEQNERALATLADNLWRHLSEQLDPADTERLNRLFNQDVMTLAADQFNLEGGSLIEFLRRSRAQEIQFPGLNIRLESLSAQYQQRSEDEIRQRIVELRQERDELDTQLKVAEALDAARSLEERLAREARDIERDLEAFDRLTELKQSEAVRNA